MLRNVKVSGLAEPKKTSVFCLTLAEMLRFQPFLKVGKSWYFEPMFSWVFTFPTDEQKEKAADHQLARSPATLS
jgi:hypothetical protein